jgi:hypothetical protein
LTDKIKGKGKKRYGRRKKKNEIKTLKQKLKTQEASSTKQILR